MAGILKRRHYRATTNDLVFREHRIQPHRVGDRHRSIYLAGTPPPATGGSVAASAHPAQPPLHRVGIPRPRAGRVGVKRFAKGQGRREALLPEAVAVGGATHRKVSTPATELSNLGS